MKKLLSFIAVAAIVLSGILTLGVTTANADTSIQGTVAKGSTAEIIKVDTSEGTYEIKIDSGTQFTGGKNLLPGRGVTVSFVHGNDAYLHAVTIKAGGANGIFIDNSTKKEISGKIKDVADKETVFVEASDGDYEVKIDDGTDLSGTNFLIAGNSYVFKIAKGSDSAYHALSISDTYASSSSSSYSSTVTTSSYSYTDSASLSGETYTCTGTVTSSTKPGILYLNCSDGERQLKIDASTDTSRGFLQLPGAKLTATYRYGSDAYWHAVCVEGEVAKNSGASVKSDNPTTVVGTVSSKTTPEKLFLDVSNGTMEIKLDTLNNLDGIKVINQGMKVTVKIGYGSDAYWHALSISG
ncbi:MAG: hypothetical protein K5888_01845 [Lachnospiraceae bacterium]|nr:hypothetical protein [Lachnospiraceae bacterium]